MVSANVSRSLTTRLSGEAYGHDIDVDGKRSWDFSGTCSQPRELRLRGLPDEVCVRLGMETEFPHVGYMYVRCRCCEECLQHRSALWAARACSEMKVAQRTWFGTLTVAPEHRIRALYTAQNKISRGGADWSELSETERFASVVAFLGPEIGKMLKRVRKNADASFRYLLVVEAHKDGFPHFHLLLHEMSTPVRKAVLDAAWKLGFTKYRLVEGEGESTAFYVAKYLAKSAMARVRASQKYGRPRYGAIAERLENAIAILGSKTRLSYEGPHEDQGIGQSV